MIPKSGTRFSEKIMRHYSPFDESRAARDAIGESQAIDMTA
jgi:hypothetical protein